MLIMVGLFFHHQKFIKMLELVLFDIHDDVEALVYKDFIIDFFKSFSQTQLATYAKNN